MSNQELLTPREMGEVERAAMDAGLPGAVLMDRAGRAVAAAVRKLAPANILVVAGTGNNGGDGLVAAGALAADGFQVRVCMVGDRAAVRGDAAAALAGWNGPVETRVDIAGADLIVDALFGAGLNRPVEGAARAAIVAMNQADNIVAVDLPSGINGATGEVMGCAVRARQTVTFFRRKPGHLLMPGRQHCGAILVADIGIPADLLAAIKAPTFENTPDLWSSDFPQPRSDGHKYTRGHAVVASGGIASTGSARLAARGALRAGAGLVTIASPTEALAVNAAASLAVMVRPVDSLAEFRAFLADERRNSAVVGPGGGVGSAMRDQVLTALASGAAVVLDADALTSFAGEPQALAAAIKARRPVTVLTPHAGEFQRLFKSLEDIFDLKDNLSRARRAAAFTGAIMVCKGPDTVVASPDGRACIAANAPPFLATAGAGDVLAGVIAGLLAQGMPGFEAASAAVWLHGEAANAFGPGLIAEDLPEALPSVYRRLFAQRSDVGP